MKEFLERIHEFIPGNNSPLKLNFEWVNMEGDWGWDDYKESEQAA
jgi:hypothetical protein